MPPKYQLLRMFVELQVQRYQFGHNKYQHQYHAQPQAIVEELFPVLFIIQSITKPAISIQAIKMPLVIMANASNKEPAI